MTQMNNFCVDVCYMHGISHRYDFDEQLTISGTHKEILPNCMYLYIYKSCHVYDVFLGMKDGTLRRYGQLYDTPRDGFLKHESHLRPMGI